MTALEMIKKYEESRQGNAHDLGNADIDFLLRAFHKLRSMCIDLNQESGCDGDRIFECDAECDDSCEIGAPVDLELEKRMAES